MRRGDLHGIKRFTRCGLVTAWLCVINRRKTCLAETGRILNDFIPLAVALVILIGGRIQRLVYRIGTADFNHRSVTNRRLRRRDGRLLLTIIT
ncbi:hypothetical protein D3C72_2035720 [compost metagenome]